MKNLLQQQAARLFLMAVLFKGDKHLLQIWQRCYRLDGMPK